MGQLLNEFLPPIIKKYINSRKWKFEGNYKSWAEALNNCNGYDSFQVVKGMKERHEVWIKSYQELNKQTSYLDLISRNILSYFFYPIIELDKTIINVLDIGGAAGGHFSIVRDNLPTGKTLNWTINETQTAVNEFSKSFPQSGLTFNSNIKDLYASNYDIIYMSGTLQDLESPYSIFESIKIISHKYLIITRLPLIDSNNDYLTIQHVPKSYYAGSYPSWFFSSQKFVSFLDANYRIIQKWEIESESVVLNGVEVFYKGYLLKLK